MNLERSIARARLDVLVVRGSMLGKQLDGAYR